MKNLAMYLWKFILIFLSVVFLMGDKCNGLDSETRRLYKWTGIINSQSGDVDCVVKCDTGCVTCTATVVKSGLRYIITDQDHPIIKKCLQLPKGTTGNPNLFTVTFIAATGISNKFGFDNYHDDAFNFTSPIHISLAVGDSTKFYTVLHVKKGAFNSFEIRIENSNYLSFTKGGAPTKSKEIDTGTTLITLYSLSTAMSGTNADIKVVGISGYEEYCFAGSDCETRDEQMSIHFYDQRLFTNQHVYRVDSATFNPDTAVWRNEFNNVLKQAVLKINSVDKKNFNDNSWDDNGNGILDFFVSKDNIPTSLASRLENVVLLMKIETAFGSVLPCGSGSESNQEPKIMIVPGTIRRNWLLNIEAKAGKDTIELNSPNGVIKSLQLYIGPWSGNVDREIISIKDKCTAKKDSLKFVINEKLLRTHSQYEVVYDYTATAVVHGFTIESCSWVENVANYRNIIHEYLHTKRLGPLSHTTKDTKNVMYPFSGSYGSQLRYRNLDVDSSFGNTIENQWDILH